MPQRPKAGPASKAKTFCFQKQLYVLPDMDAAEVTNVQPNNLMMKLKACNSRLPPQEENVAFVSAAFHFIQARLRGFLTDVELRRAKYQWKANFVEYKAGFKRKESSTPGTQKESQTRHKEFNVVIDSKDYYISHGFKMTFLDIGFQEFAAHFISINPSHPQQDFTPSVLEQAFNAYVTLFPNISSERRRHLMQRKTCKRTRTFLKDCAILSAATARVEAEAATCSAESGSSDRETETDGDETRTAADSSDGDDSDIPKGIVPATDHPAASTSDGDDSDIPQGIVPAADPPAASTSTESEVEGRSSIQGSTEDDGDGSSVITSDDSEVETQEVVADTDEPASESPSDHSSYDKMDIDDEPQDLQVESQKRQRESTSSPSTHPPRAKRLRVAESPTPASGDTSIKHYGPGRDIFSALEEHLNIWSEKYNVEIASMARRYIV